MVLITRKDGKESLENLIRRFNKKLQMAGTLGIARRNQYFEKPLSKRDRRAKAIVRNQRKREKFNQARLGH